MLIPSPKPRFAVVLATLCVTFALTACSPQYNWRDYNSTDAPYSVLFPDKPSSHTRSIDLDGMAVQMTMTAAQVDGAMFAVGSAVAPDAASAEAALAKMKTALLRNLGATVNREKASASVVKGVRSAAIEIEAAGVQKGVPMRLTGRFVARDKRFYQVVVIGPQKATAPEQVQMFLSSFKPN